MHTYVKFLFLNVGSRTVKHWVGQLKLDVPAAFGYPPITSALDCLAAYGNQFGRLSKCQSLNGPHPNLFKSELLRVGSDTG